MRSIITLVILMSIHNIVIAQKDTTLRQYQDEFEQFSNFIHQEFDSFRNQNDSIFSETLKNSWQQFNILFNAPQPRNKPNQQPKVKLQNQPARHEIHIPGNDKYFHKKSGDSLSVEPASHSLDGTDKGTSLKLDFEFFGDRENTISPAPFPSISSLDSNQIRFCFDIVSKKNSTNQLVEDLKIKKEYLNLNDWGYYKLVQSLVSSLAISYPKNVLMEWILLLKSGYNVKLGYKEENIFLLAPIKEEVYSWFYEIEGTPYYVIPISTTSPPPKSLIIHTNNYKGNNISLQLNHLPKVGNSYTTRTVLNENTVEINKNEELIEFLGSYPICNDLSIFFNTPLSSGIAKSCNHYMQEHLVDTSYISKITFLLNFIQQSFIYQTDRDQFGTERCLFADQLFHFPYSDCEDRSVLFCRLVKQLTGQDCIGLIYPDHVATAVYIPEYNSGNYLTINRKEFVVCDPTYKGAPIGYLDKKYQKYIPEIITLN